MVGVVLFGLVAMVAVVTSFTTPGCSVVWCSSCSCSGVDVVEGVVWCGAVVVVVVGLMLLKL